MKTFTELWNLYLKSTGLDKMPRSERCYCYIFGVSVTLALVTAGSWFIVPAIIAVAISYKKVKSLNIPE